MGIFEGMAHTYPLMRGGGVFFILVGLGIVIGGIGACLLLLPLRQFTPTGVGTALDKI